MKVNFSIIRFAQFVFIAILFVLFIDRPAGAINIYSENFNIYIGGFSISTTGAGTWSYDSISGTCLTSGPSPSCQAPQYSTLTSPQIQIANDGSLTLSFDHRYSFEYDGTRWDGGQVQISENGGAFTPALNSLQNGYIGTIQGNNVLNGQLGFNGDSLGYASGSYITSIFDLGMFNSGDILQLRFLAAWDECSVGTYPNWQINSLQLDSTAAPVPEPSTFVLLGAGLAGLVAWRRKRS